MKTIQWPEQYSYDLGERFAQRRHDKKTEMDAFLRFVACVCAYGVLLESFYLSRLSCPFPSPFLAHS